MRLDHHLALLAHPRTLALRTRIRDAVQPGQRILDAGTGSGILGVWAAMAGAEQVVAVDREHSGLAQALAEENGVGDRVTFVSADLATWTPEGMFDGMCAMIYENDPRRDEGASRLTQQLATRALRPGGWLIPDSVRYLARLVDWPEQDHATHLDRHSARIAMLEPQLGLSLSCLRSRLRQSLALDLFPARRPDGCLPGGRALAPEALAFTLTNGDPGSAYPTHIACKATRPGLANTLIWTQQLMAGQSLLFANESISWLANPVTVTPGMTVTCALDADWRRRNILVAT